ncbi:hypothetical protein JTB14_028188 [Gonioctena quinquepunctata]|nr:hypothetical protein JTB14_028188 [Gonioctena quinquepunctata]
MVWQDRSNTNEALILDNANPSMDQLSVESPAFCNEMVIEEEDLTLIGLPQKKKGNTVAFAKKSHHEKQNVILNSFVEDSNIVKDIINRKFLETFYLEMLPEEISHAVLDGAIDIHMIRSFCTEEAFVKIVNQVEQKRLRQRLPCSVCSEDTEKSYGTLLSRVPSMETYSLCRIVKANQMETPVL